LNSTKLKEDKDDFSNARSDISPHAPTVVSWVKRVQYAQTDNPVKNKRNI